MNFSKLALLLLLVLSIAACGEDDEDVMTTCMRADWVGTYTGTETCDGDTDNTTVTITAIGTDAIVVEYQTASTITTFDPITVDGCSISISGVEQGITVTLDATLADDALTFITVISATGVSSTCTIEATRN